MRRKGFDIYIGLRGHISYVETIETTNPLVADTYAYDKAIDKYGDVPNIVWRAVPALILYEAEEGRFPD